MDEPYRAAGSIDLYDKGEVPAGGQDCLARIVWGIQPPGEAISFRRPLEDFDRRFTFRIELQQHVLVITPDGMDVGLPQKPSGAV